MTAAPAAGMKRPYRGAVRCRRCSRFTPSPINPDSGMGTCESGVPYTIGPGGKLPLYPDAGRVCGQFKPATEGSH